MLAALALFASPLTASASSAGGFGYVTQLNASTTGGVFFSVTGADVHRANTPSCGAGNPNAWVIDGSTAAGAAAIQVLLAAYSQHKPIAVTGLGSCTIRSDVEAVDVITLADS